MMVAMCIKPSNVGEDVMSILVEADAGEFLTGHVCL
jgi:hypothetical protein